MWHGSGASLLISRKDLRRAIIIGLFGNTSSWGFSYAFLPPNISRMGEFIWMHHFICNFLFFPFFPNFFSTCMDLDESGKKKLQNLKGNNYWVLKDDAKTLLEKCSEKAFYETHHPNLQNERIRVPGIKASRKK